MSQTLIMDALQHLSRNRASQITSRSKYDTSFKNINVEKQLGPITFQRMSRKSINSKCNVGKPSQSAIADQNDHNLIEI